MGFKTPEEQQLKIDKQWNDSMKRIDELITNLKFIIERDKKAKEANLFLKNHPKK